MLVRISRVDYPGLQEKLLDALINGATPSEIRAHIAATPSSNTSPNVTSPVPDAEAAGADTVGAQTPDAETFAAPGEPSPAPTNRLKPNRYTLPTPTATLTIAFKQPNPNLHDLIAALEYALTEVRALLHTAPNHAAQDTPQPTTPEHA